jgi:hypothetical protein
MCDFFKPDWHRKGSVLSASLCWGLDLRRSSWRGACSQILRSVNASINILSYEISHLALMETIKKASVFNFFNKKYTLLKRCSIFHVISLLGRDNNIWYENNIFQFFQRCSLHVALHFYKFTVVGKSIMQIDN